MHLESVYKEIGTNRGSGYSAALGWQSKYLDMKISYGGNSKCKLFIVRLDHEQFRFELIVWDDYPLFGDLKRELPKSQDTKYQEIPDELYESIKTRVYNNFSVPEVLSALIKMRGYYMDEGKRQLQNDLKKLLNL